MRSHLEQIVAAQEGRGQLPAFLEAADIGCLAISGNRVVMAQFIPGLEIATEELADGVKMNVKVAPGFRSAKPVHLCIGTLGVHEVQRIIGDFEIGAGAHVEFMACCSFPYAKTVQHLMEARTHLGPGASVIYRETHHHNGIGGVTIKTRAKVTIDEGARYFSGLSVTEGRAGNLDITYDVDVAAHGLAELNARGLGFGDDLLVVNESIHLNGLEARGLAKSRLAVSDTARSEVTSLIEGNAPYAWGHVDCVEIVQDEAVAKAIPLVVANHEQAHLTHEAAIGTVDHRELETLLARGVDEKSAIDIIVRGMLGEGVATLGKMELAASDEPKAIAALPAIEARGLVRDYGSTRAVRGVSFAVAPGEVFGFLGPNGAGKTTTVRMLTTLLEPTAGTALLNGYDITREGYRARQQFGIVPEESNVYRELSARANLLFSARLYRVAKAEREARATELLDQFGLLERQHSVVDTFSRGMRRKLTIAMALMHRPSILFLDEPTAGLDVQGQRSVLEIIRQLSDQGMTILLTTHQIEEANQLCDRVAIIKGGRLVALDTPEALKATIEETQAVEAVFAPGTNGMMDQLQQLSDVTSMTKEGDKVRLQTPEPMQVLQQVTAWAESNHLEMVSLNMLGPSLEDVFVSYTDEEAQPQPPELETTPSKRRRRACRGGTRS